MERDINKLKEKWELIKESVLRLKSEFVGIDDIIDGVMETVKTWYMFPELYDRPLVVNLFGMTGTGKTSLVTRIVELLGLSEDCFYFNFAQIGECTSWEIEDKINNELSDERSNRIFVYDEFQYAATIQNGAEQLEKKSGLKPFWELMDSGKMHRRADIWGIRMLYTLAYNITRINEMCTMEVTRGVWKNMEECRGYFTDFEWKKVVTHFNVSDDGENGLFFIKGDVWEKMVYVYDKYRSETSAYKELYELVCDMDSDEIADFASGLYRKALCGYDMNFFNSLIFVIANVDEAYEMALNVDPDMSPDVFYKLSKRISIVDIKNALKKRFRNEQIARLGNIHYIYPSFSSKSFEEIIRRKLKSSCAGMSAMMGVDIGYDKHLVDLVYNESVFPTHGTRPIFSTISEMVTSKLSGLTMCLYEDGINPSSITLSAKGDCTLAMVMDGDGTCIKTYSFCNKLRVNQLRKPKKDAKQVITALHESAHFIVYVALFGKRPEKVVSATAGESYGFILECVDSTALTIDSVKKTICVGLAGYMAERMVFGESDMTIGASSDIMKVTQAITKLVRSYGYKVPLRMTYLTSELNHDDMVFVDGEKECNGIIKEILEECMDRTRNILEKSTIALKESAKYLSFHSEMPKNKMTKIMEMIPKDVISPVRDVMYYTERLENM